MAKKKEKKLVGAYQIVSGFNIAGEKKGDPERRFEADPTIFVYEKDFSTSDWKALIEMAAMVPVVETLTEGESIEIIKK